MINESTDESKLKHTRQIETARKRNDTVRLLQDQFLKIWIGLTWIRILQGFFGSLFGCCGRSDKIKHGNENEEARIPLPAKRLVVKNPSCSVTTNPNPDFKATGDFEHKAITRKLRTTSEILFHLESRQALLNLKEVQRIEVSSN